MLLFIYLFIYLLIYLFMRAAKRSTTYDEFIGGIEKLLIRAVND